MAGPSSTNHENPPSPPFRKGGFGRLFLSPPLKKGDQGDFLMPVLSK